MAGLSDPMEPCQGPGDLHLQEGGGLVPLTLPPGVTPDIAARVSLLHGEGY